MSEPDDEGIEPGWIAPDARWPVPPDRLGSTENTDASAATPPAGSNSDDVWAAYGEAASDNPTAPIPGDPLHEWIGLSASEESSPIEDSAATPDDRSAGDAPPAAGAGRTGPAAPIDGAGRRSSIAGAGQGSDGRSGWGSPGSTAPVTVVVSPTGIPFPAGPPGAPGGPGSHRKPPAAKAATGKSTAPEAAAKPTAPPSNAPPPPPPPRRRIAPWVGGIIAPVVVFMIGLSLVLSALGGGDSGGGSSAPRRTDASRASLVPASGASGASLVPTPASDDTAVAAAPVPVIPLPSTGDPDARAEAIVRAYLGSLSNGDLVTARAMTDADIDEKAIKNLESAQAIIVRSSQIGPNLMSLRLVIAEYRSTKDGPTTEFRCADWDVETASGRIAERASGQLRPATPGLIKPGDLAATLSDECQGAALKR